MNHEIRRERTTASPPKQLAFTKAPLGTYTDIARNSSGPRKNYYIQITETYQKQRSKQRKFVREGFWRCKGYLESIVGDPSLTQIQGKTLKKKQRKTKKHLRTTKKNVFFLILFLVFLCFDPRVFVQLRKHLNSYINIWRVRRDRCSWTVTPSHAQKALTNL